MVVLAFTRTTAKLDRSFSIIFMGLLGGVCNLTSLLRWGYLCGKYKFPKPLLSRAMAAGNDHPGTLSKECIVSLRKLEGNLHFIDHGVPVCVPPLVCAQPGLRPYNGVLLCAYPGACTWVCPAPVLTPESECGVSTGAGGCPCLHVCSGLCICIRLCLAFLKTCETWISSLFIRKIFLLLFLFK